MRVIKYVAGLSPANFVGKSVIFALNEVRSDERKGANGNYTQYSLSVSGAADKLMPGVVLEKVCGDFQLSYLFDRDLNALIDAWGEETDSWKGKLILVSARLEGQYSRWVLSPYPSQ